MDVRLPLAVVTCLLLTGLAAPPASAQPPAPRYDPEAVVVPPRTVEDRLQPGTDTWVSGEDGLGFQAGTAELAWRTFARLADGRLVELPNARESQVAVVGGLVVTAEVDGGTVRAYDPLTLQFRQTRARGLVRAATPQGVLSTAVGSDSTSELLFTAFDGSERLVARFPARRLNRLTADPDGFAVVLQSEDGTSERVVAVDVSGEQRTLAVLPRDPSRTGSVVGPLAAGSGHVAWSSEGRVSLARRDGAEPVRTREAPGAQLLAVRTGDVGWVSFGTGGYAMSTAPHDPTAPATTFLLRGRVQLRAVQPAPEGYVLLRSGADGDEGFTLVRPGGADLEPYLDAPREPAVLGELRLDHARLLVEDEVLDGDVAVRRVLQGLDRRVRLGEEDVLRAGPTTLVQSVFGRRLVELLQTPTGRVLRVSEDGREMRRLPAPDDLLDVQVSGRRMLLVQGEPTSSRAIHCTVVDLPTGTQVELGGHAALWGPYVVYHRSGEGVVRWDLDDPRAPLRLVRAGAPTTALLHLDGDDVVVEEETGATLHRLTAGGTASVRVPADGEVDGVQLRGGALLVQTGGLLVAHDVGALVAGDQRPAPVGGVLPDEPLYDTDDDATTWLATDGRVRVRPLPVQVARAPRVLSVTAAPATADGAWRFEAEASEPLRDWRLELRDGRGRLAGLWSGSALDGAVRAAWDGRLPSGARAPDGVYRWTLTGLDADGDGALRGPSGGPAPSAQLAVRRAPPALALSAPVVSALASTSRTFPVRWSAPSGLRVDLRVAEVTRGVVGPSRAWITGTLARSATFGAGGSPTRPLEGRTYRVTAVARDELGRSSAPRAVTTVVPYDDRSGALRYAGSWASTPASGRYGGTLRVSSTRGSSVTVTGEARTLRVLADRCPSCGRFSVVLDGRVLGTVDTRSSATRARQVVWSRALPSSGRHVLQLRVVSGRVALDGIALGQ